MAAPADDPNVTLTIRLIMQGKEVGSIIGKKGEIVKKFREESGARINISDGSSPERIVTITGNTNGIIKAFDLICHKLEEVYNMPKAENVPKPPITLRLIVPASQCGSLIGKGGSKIREIREVTGASIQVASEMLPNSTERAVTISGMNDAITKCIYHICMIMLESPPKGGTVPYRPRPGPPGPGQMMMSQGGGGGGFGMQGGGYAMNPADQMGKMGGSPLAGLAALGLGGIGGGPNAGPVNPAAPLAALAALAGSQLRTGNNRQQQSQQNNHVQQEMTVPNELIGCVIGKGGTKIAEIRQISGAMIRISNSEELREGCTDRIITMTGNPDSVALAQYLINMSVELQRANLDGTPNSGGGTASGEGSPTNSSSTGGPTSNGAGNSNSSLASALPLAKLLSNPLLSTLGALGSLGGLNELLAGAASVPGGGGGHHHHHSHHHHGNHGPPHHHHQQQQHHQGAHHGGHTTGVHRGGRSSYTPKIKSSGSSPPPKSKNESRNKFAPY